jgi:hypothetical protein
MARQKKKIVQPIREIEIINRRTRKRRKIYPFKKEIIIYNEELNEFQLLSHASASYEVNSEPKNG